MGQKHSYNLNRAKVTRQSTQIIQDEIASTAEPTHPSEPVPLGVRTSLDGSDYVRREMERQEQQEKLAKCQENGTSGQGKGQEVPLESEAIAVEGSQTVAEPVEEDVPKCNVVVLKCEENAMESQTGEEEVPQCQENAMENQSEPVVEPFADAIPSPQANPHEVEAVPEFANDALKSEESATDVQETGKAEVEAVQNFPTINQLVEECVAGTKDVLLEVQAVGLLIHENEEHPGAESQTDDGEVPKSGGEENGKAEQTGKAAREEGRESIDQVLEDKTGASADVPEEEMVISQCHISDQSDSKKEGLIINQEELISQGEPTNLANAGPPISQESEKDGLIDQQEQQQITLISEEGLISEEKQQSVTQATTDEEALLISIQLNELTISPAKELDADGGKDAVVQLQKLVANGIASGEVGQIVADVVQNVVQTDAAATPAIQHGHQQQPQAVVELAVDEPPSNGRPEHEAEKNTPMTNSTSTTVLVVNNDENDADDAQLATPLNTNDVNIVEVNSRKPSNV
ncbi:hypothetical protein niasHS_005429 [Heterodera schachtii]|uniref:Uncharacterized protein n=1 Tax=Heterodera schachtii TaxID=97005 RepID=A0ABD2JJ01_HETSC